MSSGKVTGISKKQLRVMQAHEERKHKRKLMDGLQLPHEAVTSEMVEERVVKSRVDRLLARLKSKGFLPPTTRKQDIQRKLQAVPANVQRIPFAEVLKRHVGWLSLAEQDSGASLSLTEELERFAEYVCLHECEIASREALIDDVKEVVLTKWPHAQVNAFGSYAAQLSIFLSDVDLSILFPEDMNVLREDEEHEQHRDAHSEEVKLIETHAPPTAKKAPQTAVEKAKRAAEVIDLTADDESASNGIIEVDSSSSSESEAPKEGKEEREDEEDEEEESLWVIDTKGDRHASAHSTEKTTAAPSSSSSSSSSAEKESSAVADTTTVTTTPSSSPAVNSAPVTAKTTAAVPSSQSAAVPSIAGQKRKLAMDDVFDDDASDTTSSYETPSEVEKGEQDEDEELAGDAARVSDSLEENLELQLVDKCYQFEMLSDEPDIFDGRIRSLHSSELDFSNSFAESDFAEHTVHYEERDPAELAREREEQVQKLRELFVAVKSMDWVSALEFRHRARVPIINFRHVNEVECDVSLGLQAKDTSELLRKIKDKAGYALFAISAFLKVFLGQLGLDQPYVGGLGSFKLYVLIARHIDDNPALIADRDLPNLGLLLLSFLKHYGRSENLNESTVITIAGEEEAATVPFDQIKLVKHIQRAFHRAYTHLDAKCRERFLQNKDHFDDVEDTLQDMDSDFSSGSDSDSDSENDSETESDSETENNRHSHSKKTTSSSAAAKKPNSTARSHISSSLLAPLLDTPALHRAREQHLQKCLAYPRRKESDRQAIAQAVLDKAREIIGPQFGSLSLSQVAAHNPMLATRLRALGSLKRAFATEGGNSGGYGGNAYNNPFASHGMNRHSYGRDINVSAPSQGTSKRYSFSNYGVVGDSIKASTPHIGTPGSAKKRYARKQSFSSSPHMAANTPSNKKGALIIAPIAHSDQKKKKQKTHHNEMETPHKKQKKDRRHSDPGPFKTPKSNKKKRMNQ